MTTPSLYETSTAILKRKTPITNHIDDNKNLTEGWNTLHSFKKGNHVFHIEKNYIGKNDDEYHLSHIDDKGKTTSHFLGKKHQESIDKGKKLISDISSTIKENNETINIEPLEEKSLRVNRFADTPDKAKEKRGAEYARKIKDKKKDMKEGDENEENTENLDEISKETLGSYIKKAYNNASKKEIHLNNPTSAELDAALMGVRRKYNRKQNVSKAIDRLTKENEENTDKLAKEEEENERNMEQNNLNIGDIIVLETNNGNLEVTLKDFIGYDDGEITDLVVEFEDEGELKEEIISLDELSERTHPKDDEDLNETEAQDSLKPNSHPVNDPKSRVGYITTMIGAMHTMTDDELCALHDKAIGQIGHEADLNPTTAEANKASIKPKSSPLVTREDVISLFDGQDLSEDFKDKTTILFEAAVKARMLTEEKRMTDEFAASLNEEIEKQEEILSEIVIDLNEKVETYLDYVAAKWLEENEVAIESAIRNEMTADFMKGLKDLFMEHYIDIPENSVDALEELANKNAELEQKLDEIITENAELKNNINEATADELFLEVADGLALSQAEKFRALSEDVTYTGDDDKYKEKLKLIREAHFKNNNKKPEAKLEDTFEAPESLIENVNPEMKPYVHALNKMGPKLVVKN